MKSKFSSDLLQKIKDSTNIIDIVGEHVVLRKSGANHVGLCPFHSERTPSFSVSENKQLFHCYGCQKGGDLLTFVQDILGLSFLEAVEELAERARIPLPSDWKGATPEAGQKKSAQKEKQALAYKLNRFCAAYYFQTLHQLPQVAQYVRGRGIHDEMARIFYLGAAPDSWDSLTRHIISKKAPIQLAEELGLIRQSPKNKTQGPGYFDLFRNRVLFPILNLSGKIAGFGGRVLGEDTPKYLNSPESLVFQKSKLAFGLYQAQKYIRELDEVILVEGYFDVLAMHSAGIKNVVATCGTALSPDHLALLGRFAKKIIVLFDGDKAGIAATERAMEVGLDHGTVLYGSRMPVGKDPDEVLLDPKTGRTSAEGLEEMISILRGAEPLLDSRIHEMIQEGLSGPEAKSQSIKAIAGWLNRFQDPVGREVRVQMVQKQLGLTGPLLSEAMSKSPRPKVKHSDSLVSPVPVQQKKMESLVSPIHRMDRILLSGLMWGHEYSQILAEARGKLPPKRTLGDLLQYVPAIQFVGTLATEAGLFELLRKAPERVLERVEDVPLRSVLTETLVSTEPLFGLEDFRGAVMRALARNWARFSQEIKAAMVEAEARKDAVLQMELMKDYLDVQRKMKEFNNFYDEA